MTKERIVFMGTPEFAVASLEAILNAGGNVVGIITAPDRPAGRGMKLQPSAVKQFALDKGLHILQPSNLRSEAFQAELKALNASIQVVVAFRMLPEAVWNMPPKGTINLHASLLPHYRGAAPINWAIINGEKETGVSTFFLQHQIDTGDIIFQEKVSISENETAGELHDELMLVGAKLIVKTLQSISNGTHPSTPQTSFSGQLKQAPKIFKETCRIDWSKSVKEVHDHIRGLSPYPTAYSILSNGDNELNFKIFKASISSNDKLSAHGTVLEHDGQFLIACSDGFLEVWELQLAGKNRVKAADFLRGFQLDGYRAI